jgi:ABC-type sugar transport system ATPase subunit
MVGRDLKAHYPRPPWKPGTVALTVRNLQNAQVRDVSFELRYGEILGFAGLVGPAALSWPALCLALIRCTAARFWWMAKSPAFVARAMP